MLFSSQRSRFAVGENSSGTIPGCRIQSVGGCERVESSALWILSVGGCERVESSALRRARPGPKPARISWAGRNVNGDGKAPRPFPRWTRERHGGPGRSGQGTHTRACGADLPGLRRRLSARSDPQRAARHPQPPAPWRHSCRSPGRRKFGGEPPAKSRKQKPRLRPGPGFAQKSVLLVNSRTQERSQTWSTDCRAWV